MKLMTLPQYMKMSKPALIRKITKSLRVMPKKRLAGLCYEITKSKLPRISIRKRKALPKRKTKKKVGIIYTAKNGRKYKILASGKARFVKS